MFLFSKCRSGDVLKAIGPFPFRKLIVYMQVNKTNFERDSSSKVHKNNIT